MLLVSVISCLLISVLAKDAVTPRVGSQCTKNQVVRKLTVYEDGALEAECGPVPCGEVGKRCIDVSLETKIVICILKIITLEIHLFPILGSNFLPC